MDAVTLRGTYRGASGYDRLVRGFARELHRQGIRIQLIDIPDWHPARLAKEQWDPWFDSLSSPVGSRLILHFCLPTQVVMPRGTLNANFTMFEATRIPKKWVVHNRRHDLVIVPAESSRAAWIESGHPPDRIRVCPLGIDPSLFQPGVEPWPLRDDRGRSVGEYAVRVLNILDLVPRKNVLGLLRVWIKSTTPTDDAVLVLKLNAESEELLRTFWRSLEDMEARIGKTRQEAAPIVFLVNQVLSDAEMTRLYAAATHYWSMSYGEGWDQPMMEAAAMGLHLIAPRHSAYTTYLDESVATLLPSRRIPAIFEARSDSLHKFFQGADCWEPDEQAAADSVIRAIARGPVGPNLPARARVVEKYSWKVATLTLIDILNELDARPPQRSGILRRFADRLWPR